MTPDVPHDADLAARARLGDREAFQQLCDRHRRQVLQIAAFEANDAASAVLAGEAWQRYREGGGRRTALVPDFLVAAHAVAHADRLLTRDRGFAARFFRGLTIVDPSR